MKTWLMALALAASGIGGVAMAQQGNAPGTIVRKDLLTAAINASTDAPATFVAFYLLGAEDQKIIEMLQ